MPNSQQTQSGSVVNPNELQGLVMPSLSKLTTLQTLIPHFDNSSAVTPSYLFETLESLMPNGEFSDNERLIVAKSRIRGEALSKLISSRNLSTEKNYAVFKQKIIDLFEQTENREMNQFNFTHIKQFPSETLRQFGARIVNATEGFFGQVDYEQPEIKKLFQQTLLAKFMEGVEDKFKTHLITKQPTTLKEALNFTELIETNLKLQNQQAINLINDPGNDLVLQTHIQKTHESISNLTKRVENLTMDKQAPKKVVEKYCTYCKKTNHDLSNCFLKEREQNRQREPRSSQRRDYGRDRIRDSSFHRERDFGRNNSGSRDVNRQNAFNREGPNRRDYNERNGNGFARYENRGSNSPRVTFRDEQNSRQPSEHRGRGQYSSRFYNRGEERNGVYFSRQDNRNHFLGDRRVQF